jgi:arylsulfatase A-like enzyme
MIKLPGQKKGGVIHGTASLLQVFPTIVRLLGSDPSDLKLQGAPIKLSECTKLPDDIIFSARKYTNLSATSQIYKFIVREKTKKEELFNTARDPAEKVNIAAQDPRTCRIMRQAIQHREAAGKRIAASDARGAGTSPFTEQEKERLRHLGYLAN